MIRCSFVLVLATSSLTSLAREIHGIPKTHSAHKTTAACSPATSQVELDVNNVRARLLGGGDMWWDLAGNAKYEVPKVQPGSGQPSVHSLFAGALWIGGIDAGGQLKIAAQTYRQSGNDFWPGPLSENGSTSDDVCNDFDRHWKVTREEIDDLVALKDQHGPNKIPVGDIPQSILEWPAAGNEYARGANNALLSLGLTKAMAPYMDRDGVSGYDPTGGDYPDVLGDQAVWWIYNDRGHSHTETGGEAIGLEIQALAFAFATNDEINDMTFYRYTVRNFSTTSLDSVFFGQWTDADLGSYDDDYVGCDTSRDMGIIYNGDPDDLGIGGYGTEPPLLGIDYFQGPRELVGVIGNDTIWDTLGMAHFTYYNNDASVIGNPDMASDYYGYLSGTWKDGSHFTFGGTGYQTGPPTDFVFPDDPKLPKPFWSECSEGNEPGDRRFIQSSGPFRLDPGAVNEVIIGAVWVRQGSQVGCQADFDLLRGADDRAQALFDNKFKIVEGPDAPDMTLRELDREIILSLDYNPSSNNFNETYEERDPVICTITDDAANNTNGDCTYNFQGYKVFQLRDATVSSSEFGNPDKARLIAQWDLKDNVTKLVNLQYDLNLGAEVPKLMVDGTNSGIRHSFRVTEDAFATGDKRLVNFKTYCFSVIAYAENNYLPYDPANSKSQRRPYLEGRKNIRAYSAVPHRSDPENHGSILKAAYGDGPETTRLEGEGNGGNAVDLSAASIEEILLNNFTPHPVYVGGAGPVNVRVYDPVKVPAADFELIFSDTADSASVKLSPTSTWRLINLTTGEEWTAERTIAIANEQLIPELGLAITIAQTGYPGPTDKPDNNGFIEATIEYADPGARWLSAVPDDEGITFFNWIRSGAFDYDPDPDPNINPPEYDDAMMGGAFLDGLQHYENVIEGAWSPFRLLGGMSDGQLVQHMPMRFIQALAGTNRLDSTASIDLVFTPDKSKWTRCVVIEMNENQGYAEGGREKCFLRAHASLNLDGSYDPGDQGRSWFPGYAINVETGQRLNIIFSEDSWQVGDNGNDMLWNPTDRLISPAGQFGYDIRFGGKHYIYVSNTLYDEGEAIWTLLAKNNYSPSQVDLRHAFKSCIWASMAMLAQGFEMGTLEGGLVPTETKVRLRVHMPYRRKTVTGENDGVNKYWFSTRDLATITGSDSVASSALDLIRVVPNPYYAYSTYEKSQLDQRVKVTNLPPQCTVTIYATDGTMVRRLVRNVNPDLSAGALVQDENLNTSLDWDLKNSRDIPIASGLYIIHVEAPGLGEKVLKWFGVMRPVDLDTF